MTLKQTFLNHFKAAWIAIFTTILYLIGWGYFGFKEDYLLIFIGFYFITVVPSFFLHMSYYFRNKGMVVEILPDRIRLKKGKIEFELLNIDIREIVVFKSASMDKGGIPITPMEAYFFARVYCNNEEKYELTCLLDANIDISIRSLRGVKIFRENGFLNVV